VFHLAAYHTTVQMGVHCMPNNILRTVGGQNIKGRLEAFFSGKEKK
jgi:hypothetical protein